MSFFYILLGIFMFGLIILIHEFGHYIFAKVFKVGINEFAIGMGPKIFSKKGKDGVDYSLRLIPMGGYVSMVGEDEKSNDESALCNKSVWKRIIIVSAGAIFNIILGFILMSVIVIMSKSIYSTTVDGFNVLNENGEILVIDTLHGINKGDKIIKVNNNKINVKEDFLYEVMFIGNEKCDVTVIRNGKEVVVKDVKFDTYTENGITFGNAGYVRTTELEKTVFEVVRQSVYRSFASIRVLWISILNTFKGEYGTESLSGPIGVIEQVEETASYGFDSLLFLMVMLTINVGMMNLLPIPALDGGRLFFMLIELIRGKPINPKYEGYIHAAGFVLLIALMIFVTFNDIVKIFTR